MVSKTPSMLPVIDFTGGNLKPGTSAWIPACDDARRALEEYGCFVALYDKIPPELENTAFRALEELFDLSTETKVKNTSSWPYHGYVGKIPHLPIHESMGIEHATTLERVEEFTNLMWPAGHDHFCETMYSYAKLLSELEQTVNRMVFENYGIEKYHNSHVGSTYYILRFLKYRPPEKEESNLGADPHTDKDFLTILHQNQLADGLEVQARNGEWIAVDLPAASKSFVVMAGDVYMAWSNGRVHPPRHKVAMRGDKTRYVFALFSYVTGTIRVPEELVDDSHPLQFNPFENLGLMQFYLTDLVHRTESTVKAYCGV